MTLVADVAVRRGDLSLDVAFEAAEGDMLAIVGPNAAGKSTLLRALAGLPPAPLGRVELDRIVMDDPAAGIRLPADRRPVGMVFQDALLFPHLSVLENVGFGPRSRGASRHEARAAAQAWLERLAIGHLAGHRPVALSGGQAQRVALARALAIEPRLLLLDEPLASVDASSRPALRRELRQHLASFTGVRLLVTHDPIEALALGTRLLVLEQGRRVQEGTPQEIAARPRSAYVADLVGLNLLPGEGEGGRVRVDGGGQVITADSARGPVFALIHPRAVALHRSRPEGTPRNVWQGMIDFVEPRGEQVRVRVHALPSLVAEVTAASVAQLGLSPGAEVWVSVKASEVATYQR
ncbi:MAG: ABC transporter ATP-binding protein [Actinomycetota bacterium]